MDKASYWIPPCIFSYSTMYNNHRKVKYCPTLFEETFGILKQLELFGEQP